MPRKNSYQAYGLFICKELRAECLEHRITPHEMWLLAEIDNYISWLVRHSNDPAFSKIISIHLHKKHGAWLTNRNLGDRLNVSPKTVANMLLSLSKKGLIFRTVISPKAGKKRLLKTCWTDALLEVKKKQKKR